MARPFRRIWWKSLMGAVRFLCSLALLHLAQVNQGDFTFECVGNVGLMRSALEACHKVRRSWFKVFWTFECVNATSDQIASKGMGHEHHHWSGSRWH
jgi:hypothetical protein